MLVRRGDEVLAVGATCTHYSGPLAEGLVVGDTVRCPWHHACFDLRTGAPERAPALNPIPCYAVIREGTRIRVGARREIPPPAPAAAARKAGPATGTIAGAIAIIGAGAAGESAAESLRREGYAGDVLLIGADESPPVDRPNLSKDYLAGTAPEEWIPLRPPSFFEEHRIEVALGARVTAFDAGARTLTFADGRTRAWDALLLATGADAIRLAVPGADLPHVRTLRTLADSRAIIERVTADGAATRRAVIVGASFIGMEAAASLRARGVEVHVVAPETQPFARTPVAVCGRVVEGGLTW